MLDFDDGKMRQEDLQEQQQTWDFDSYVFSSQNHQKPKDGKPPCDRLRVLIPFDTPITNLSDLNAIKSVMLDKFGKDTLDPTCVDAARYFAHGTSAVSSFVESRGALNWQELLEQHPVRQKPTAANNNNQAPFQKFIQLGEDSGNRDNACFQAACTLRDSGYDQSTANTLLKEGADKCTPPFPHDEVKRKVESAYGYTTLPFAFIEATTAAYFYFFRGKLFPATKDILKETFKSYGADLPPVFPVFEFKYDVHDNLQIDFKNRKFNLFRPTQYHLMQKNLAVLEPEKSFETIYKLLKNLIPSEKERDHFINWLATILQTREKMMTSFVFLGTQGAGKGVFFTHVIKQLFGEIQSIQVEDEQLKSSFNGWLKNVCFIAFNEVAHDNRGRNSLNSKIKSLITDPSIIINEKNIRTYQIDNCVNCIFYSNERVPLLVEKSDRRFTIIETGGNLANQPWFDALEVFKKIKIELPAFAQYLWNLETDVKMANTVLNTDLKESLIDAGMNRFEEFAYHLKKWDSEWFESNIDGSLMSYGSFNSTNLNRVKKDDTERLFNDIYPGNTVYKTTLSKQLALYGIKSERKVIKELNDERVQVYTW